LFIFQLLFSFGIGFFFCTLNVYIRDVAPFLQAILIVWFFMTPIVYPIDKIPAGFLKYLQFNPLFPLVKMYRSLLLKNQVMDVKDLLLFAGYAIIAFVVGFIYFRRNKLSFSDYV